MCAARGGIREAQDHLPAKAAVQADTTRLRMAMSCGRRMRTAQLAKRANTKRRLPQHPATPAPLEATAQKKEGTPPISASPGQPSSTIFHESCRPSIRSISKLIGSFGHCLQRGWSCEHTRYHWPRQLYRMQRREIHIRDRRHRRRRFGTVRAVLSGQIRR